MSHRAKMALITMLGFADYAELGRIGHESVTAGQGRNPGNELPGFAA
ncbi:MAG TPA: hypothetical protein VG498_08155 [Terriglobales bacterium]|nr:hypothetical protein [Terriglobales bacterium]